MAKRWYQRGNSTDDDFARFFFYFTAFNSLFHYWGVTDHVTNSQGGPGGDVLKIYHLISEFTMDQTKAILKQSEASVTYFIGRGPIRRLDKISLSDQVREGADYLRILQSSTTSMESLESLAQILYLVRSNLVHGSKEDVGDDAQLIRNSNVPLKSIVESAIEYSKLRLRV